MSRSPLDYLRHMRDKLIHGYFGVDFDIVWEVAASKAPMLRQQLEKILAEETSGP